MKRRQDKKLKIDRETIRSLATNELDKIEGGMSAPSWDLSCIVSCYTECDLFFY